MTELDFYINCGYCKNQKFTEAKIPHSGARLDVQKIIAELDSLFAREDIAGAQKLLDSSLLEARRVGDKSCELTLQSELMGFHRRTGDRDAALRACDGGIDLVTELRLGATVSGATVLLNAATTLAAIGESERALGLFEQVLRVYSSNLDPEDYRFAGLYNNLGTAYSACRDFDRARGFYLAALELSARAQNHEEAAVTHVNLAELYWDFGREDADEVAGEHVSAALFELECSERRDGYHAFTCRKCAPTLDRLGYFFDARKLNERADRIYEGN